MREILESNLEILHPGQKNLKITSFAHISDGWESEMYAYQISHESALRKLTEKWILRLYPGEGAQQKSEREFIAMQKLYQHGYPVPKVVTLGTKESPFGKPFVIMEFIEGRLLWEIMSQASNNEIGKWITLFNRLFVQLHELDIEIFLDDEKQPAESHPYLFVDEWFANAHRMLPHFPGTEIYLETIEWLENQRNLLGCEKPSATHQDFHPNNILIQADGTGVVIDWTNFEVTDRRFDIAWSLVLANAYEGAAVRNLFLENYEQQNGAPLENIGIFEAFASVRRLFSITSSFNQGAEGMGMRPEAVEMMKSQMGAHRRVYEMLVDRTGIQIEELEKIFA